MKNKYIEQQKRQAKRYAQKWQAPLNSYGNHLPSIYPENERKKFAWWDDISFKLGSQVVAVWWMHPRQHYHDLCENLSYNQLTMPDDKRRFEWGEKIYTKVGKSRKKVTAYRTSDNYDKEVWRQYFEQREALLAKLLNESDFIVQPFMQIKQYAWGLGVDSCLPIEALDATSVNEMAQIAKRLLRRETTLSELYPNYTYSKINWLQENPIQTA